MGLYGDRVLPRLVSAVCGMRSNDAMRASACAGLHGRVVEIGFGAGHNARHYPPAVTGVDAVEPSELAWRLAAERVAASVAPVRRVGLDGQSLPLPDDSADSALSTWTLCTVPDVPAALRELRRVLRPGGALHFAEHGLAPDAGVQRWQHRLEPVQKRLAGGCHLTRPVTAVLEEAGYEVLEVERFYEKGAPRVLGAMSVGVAVPR